MWLEAVGRVTGIALVIGTVLATMIVSVVGLVRWRARRRATRADLAARVAKIRKEQAVRIQDWDSTTDPDDQR